MPNKTTEPSPEATREETPECGAINPEYTAICERPKDHDGAHRGKSVTRPVEVQWPRPSPEVAPMQQQLKGADMTKRRVVQAIVNPTVAEIMGVVDGDHFSADMAGDGSNFIVADGALWIRENVAARALMRSEELLMSEEAKHGS